MQQGVYLASATKNYPLGTRYAKRGDPLCRAWRYTQLGATTRTDGYGGVTGGLGLFSVAKDSSSLTISVAAKGATTITVTDTLTVNAYAGGMLAMYEAGQPICCLGIVSNTAHVIYLDGPLPGTYTSSATPNVIASPYNEMVLPGVSCNAAASFAPCMGIFNSPLDEDGNVAAEDDHIWAQTWGLVFMWASGTYEGARGEEREAVIRGDGAAQVVGNSGTTADVLLLSHQRIGFLYPDTGDLTTTMNNPDPSDGTAPSLMNHLIFLQIAP